MGESGCGKTTLGRTVIRLHEPTSGKILYKGEPIYDSEKKIAVDMKPYRGKMQLIFQDPSASLDPRMTVGEIIGEALDIHNICPDKKERRERIRALLAEVGLNTEHANRFPHEFSGGQQQRVGIARAFISRPDIVFADEPTGNLDSKATFQVMDMICSFARDFHQTVILVSHDPEMASYAHHIVTLLNGGIIREQHMEKERGLYESNTISDPVLFVEPFRRLHYRNVGN